MTRDEFCERYWNYYLVLESDFLITQKYVSFDLGENYNYTNQNITDLGNSECFSDEFVKQYQAICSEIDVISKGICSELCNDNNARNISQYASHILTLFPNIINQKVKFNNYTIEPFTAWSVNDSPKWWQFYNDVKHHRFDEYRKANLKNVLISLMALYTLELYFIKSIGDRDATIDVPNHVSSIFELVNFNTTNVVIGRNQYLTINRDIDAMF